MLTCTKCGREGSRGFHFAEDGKGPTCVNAEQCAKRIAKAERAKLAGRCVDCLESGDDPKGTRKLATRDDGTLQPGPRCVTHQRARRKVVSQAAHERKIDVNFELTPELYQALYESQGGKCFVCRKATGKTKRLAVEHDHDLAKEHGHDPKKGCLRCIRALCCGRCNRLVAFLDVEALGRAIELLTDPPARKILLGAERSIEVTIGEPTAIPPTLAEIDDVMDQALIDALDGPIENPDDFWAAEADADDNFWLAPVES